ncbi:MAG: oligosaccharide flippase family protein, partial [Pseudomonadota bacterium]
MRRAIRLFQGSNLKARALRSSAVTVGGFGASQMIRLASNLILTRILFPEAFGMMALVMVFLQGLAMFSDVGVGPAIMQSKRGDDPSFLNTAWTIQVVRGFVLWIVAALLAWPIAVIYGEPQLLHLLPVAALTLVIAGFTPTRRETANR